MHPTRATFATLTSIGGAGAWALLDGMLGTVAAVIAIVAGLAGLWWGYRTYTVRVEAAELDQQRAYLQLQAALKLNERKDDESQG